MSRRIVRSGDFAQVVWNSCVWTLFVVVLQNLLGFGAALLLNQSLPGQGLMRSLILLPWVLPGVVAPVGYHELDTEGRRGLRNEQQDPGDQRHHPQGEASDGPCDRSGASFASTRRAKSVRRSVGDNGAGRRARSRSSVRASTLVSSTVSASCSTTVAAAGPRSGSAEPDAPAFWSATLRSCCSCAAAVSRYAPMIICSRTPCSDAGAGPDTV